MTRLMLQVAALLATSAVAAAEPVPLDEGGLDRVVAGGPALGPVCPACILGTVLGRLGGAPSPSPSPTPPAAPEAPPPPSLDDLVLGSRIRF